MAAELCTLWKRTHRLQRKWQHHIDGFVSALLKQMKDDEKVKWEEVRELVERYEGHSSVTKIIEEKPK